MGYQQIIIQGNLTRDVEVRQVGQSQVAKTGVAVTEKFRKADGTVAESTEFFDIEIWDKAGVYPYLTKGASVLVVGQQRTDKWQDQNGQNRETKKVRVHVIQLCGVKPQAAPQNNTATAPGFAPQPPFQTAPATAPQMPPAQPQYPTPPAPHYPSQPQGGTYAPPVGGDLPF